MAHFKVKKKKILYFAEAFAGGIFTYLCNLSNSLCDDYDIYIAYGIRESTPNDFKNYFDKRVHLIKVKNYQREISLKKDLAALKEMKRIVSDIKPDIVHLNSSKAGILGRWLFRRSSMPIFYTPHGYSFLMTDVSKKKRALYFLLEKIFAFNNVKTIACSESEYEITKKLTSNATYVNNGINLAEFEDVTIKPRKRLDNLRIATLGRISFQKNPYVFNQIASALPNVDFTWIGDGDLKDQLTAPNIKITGWVNNQKALDYLNNADILLFPSLWEGLSMALLEAMYMKKICIVSNVVGNRDVIKNKKNGFIFDTPTEAINEIKNIMNSKKLPLNLAENAHKDVTNHYSVAKMSASYNSIYQNSLINQK